MESAMVERYQSAYLDEDDYPPYNEPEVVGPNEIPSDSLDDGSSSEEETEELQQIFDYIDRDRDGFITLDEMLRAEKRMADHRGSLFDEHAKRKELTEFIRDGDLNKDQKLDFKEFVMSMKLRSVGQERGYENESDSDSTDEDTRPQSRKHRKSRRKPSRKSSMTNLGSTPVLAVKRRARTRNAKWEAEKKQVITPDINDETRDRLGNVFLASDPDRDGLVDINDLAKLAPYFFDETADGISDERREGILAVKREAPTMPLMNAEQFSLLLSQRLMVTNEELKDASDFATWNRISMPSFDSTNMSLDESRVASTNLALELADSLNTRPSASAAESAAHIQRLQRALQLAIGMSDTLLEQFESAKAIAEEAASKLRGVEEELETAKVEKREAQRKLKMLQIQITDLETESAETANQVRRLQSTLKQERDAHIDKERRKRGDSDEIVSVDSVQKNITAWSDQVQRAEAQSQALFRAYDTEKRSLVEATDKWRKLEQERKQAGNTNPSPAELAQIEVVKKLKASTEQYRDELMQEINSLQSLQQAAQNVQSLKKNMMDQLNDKKAPQIPPQTPRTAGVDAGKDRSHAERNQEFFFLTALAVKMNLETRYKAANQKAPTFTPTKKLYELAMAARVPFQYYAKWIERQLDPVAAQRKQSGASNPPSSMISVTSPPAGPSGAPSAAPPPIAGGMQSRPQ